MKVNRCMNNQRPYTFIKFESYLLFFTLFVFFITFSFAFVSRSSSYYLIALSVKPIFAPFSSSGFLPFWLAFDFPSELYLRLSLLGDPTFDFLIELLLLTPVFETLILTEELLIAWFFSSFLLDSKLLFLEFSWTGDL